MLLRTLSSLMGAFLLTALLAGNVTAQDAAQGQDKERSPAAKQAKKKRAAARSKAALSKAAKRRAADHQKFQEAMKNVKFVGKFTVLGRDDSKLREEEYTIKSVKKLPTRDLWLFQARVKYGGKDITVPMPLQVKWAGDTPVITLTKTTIPGLGTFSARVVIYNKKYAGTWTHDKVGGHLFGTIQKAE